MLMYYLQLIETEADQRLFEQLYRRHKKQMTCAAYSVLHNSFLAEDAVHTAFEGIANNMKSLHDQSQNDMKNYVLKAAKNAAINIQKKERRQWALLPKLDDDVPEDSVLEALCTKETYEETVNAISRMDEPYGMVLYCHFVMEMNNKEIAAALHRKPDAVRQQLCRGKKILHGFLREALVEHV